MENKLLTVVIPAYNSSSYLGKCLESLLVEDVMNDVEIIIVNDGSTDETLKIAELFRDKYPEYFVVVNKENGNYGSCMNAALRIAKGKYFRTLDSDDWFSKTEYIEFVHDLSLTDADMLMCERYIYYSVVDKMVKCSFESGVTKRKDLDIESVDWTYNSIKNNISVNSICYKTDLIRKSGLQWTEKVFYSDNEYDYFPSKIAKTIRFVDIPVYVYWIGREGQSVGPDTLLKNYRSFQLVGTKILEDFLETADPKSNIYQYQKYLLVNHILQPIYIAFLSGKEPYVTFVNSIDMKVRTNALLMQEVENVISYSGIHFVRACKKNDKLKIILAKFLFKYIGNLSFANNVKQQVKKILGKL